MEYILTLYCKCSLHPHCYSNREAITSAIKNGWTVYLCDNKTNLIELLKTGV